MKGRPKKNIPLRYCEICKKVIPRNTKKGETRIRPKQYVKARFCSVKCRGIWQGKEKIGSNNANWKGGNKRCIDCGKELPERYSHRENCRCRSCWYYFIAESPENHPRWSGGFPECSVCGKTTGDSHSKICKDCYKGKYHHSWKDGISTENELMRSSAKNKEWRKKVFEKDDYTCQICGDRAGNNLNAHHIKKWSEYKQLRYEVENGITLCKPCHINLHRKKR